MLSHAMFGIDAHCRMRIQYAHVKTFNFDHENLTWFWVDQNTIYCKQGCTGLLAPRPRCPIKARVVILILPCIWHCIVTGWRCRNGGALKPPWPWLVYRKMKMEESTLCTRTAACRRPLSVRDRNPQNNYWLEMPERWYFKRSHDIQPTVSHVSCTSNDVKIMNRHQMQTQLILQTQEGWWRHAVHTSDQVQENLRGPDTPFKRSHNIQPTVRWRSWSGYLQLVTLLAAPRAAIGVGVLHQVMFTRSLRQTNMRRAWYHHSALLR